MARRVVATALIGLLAVAPAACGSSGDDGTEEVSGVEVPASAVAAPDHDVVPVGAGPVGITVGRDGIWVSNADDGTIARIDPATLTVTDVVPVGSEPGPIAAGEGLIWVANRADDTVSVVDPLDRVVIDTIPTGSEPTALAVGDGRAVIATDAEGLVLTVDVVTRSESAQFRMRDRPSAVALGGSAIWVLTERKGAVTTLEPETLTFIGSTDAVGLPTDVAVIDGEAFVSDSDAEGVHVFAVDDVEVADPGFIEVGADMIAVAAAGSVLWTVSAADGRLDAIDTGSRTVVASYVFDRTSADLVVHDGRVWITNPSDGTVTVFAAP